MATVVCTAQFVNKKKNWCEYKHVTEYKKWQ